MRFLSIRYNFIKLRFFGEYLFFVFTDIFFLWSVGILIIATLVTIFKKEKDINLEDVKNNIFQNYKLLWNILKHSSISVFLVTLLTSTVNTYLILILVKHLNFQLFI